ncbi:hypothetical protein BDW59DRAFT_142071 [Aspergillus cavernicola]|uniref:Phosphotransferase n=1 Tax=Aspergillus cavernicola TaxID=176166 RepID=A0ABR4IQ49_9EURO
MARQSAQRARKQNSDESCIWCGWEDTLRDWGFGCDTEDNTLEIKEFFKLHLAPHNESDGIGGSITRQEARRWFEDYISCIYKHVVTHFDGTIPGFEKMHVEFIFSVPTALKDVRMIEEIRRLISNAIRRGAPNHWACIGLTEAEAAAVYACRGYYQASDIVLVCDSGGGTTVRIIGSTLLGILYPNYLVGRECAQTCLHPWGASSAGAARECRG